MCASITDIELPAMIIGLGIISATFFMVDPEAAETRHACTLCKTLLASITFPLTLVIFAPAN
jgi:hypothetical protein